MKILFVDRHLKGKPHAKCKEGYSLYSASIDNGINAEIAGKDFDINEKQIPSIANQFDLIVVSENYYKAASETDGKGWEWWNWKDIKTPKLFWAIDTHIKNYRSFIRKNKFDFVACNNQVDVEYYGKKNWFGKTPHAFFLPLAIRKEMYEKKYATEKIHDISFIGSLISDERKYFVEKYNMNHQLAFGEDYVKAMQESKICFNISLSYDLNCKYFEILGSGSFLLSNNSNKFMYKLFGNSLLDKCIWKNEDDFENKLKYYLNNEAERLDISSKLRSYVLNKHTYHNRITEIMKQIKI